jgi:hypothetical protein
MLAAGGVREMNWKALAPILATIGIVGLACASSPQEVDDAVEEPPAIACAEPRPQACTMEYIPVCGHLYSGERKTFPNACRACSDQDVSARHPGACEEDASDEPPDGALTE